jgi:putative protease
VRGDFGLNIYNSYSLQVARDLGLISQALSFELRLEQIRDISKVIDTGIIAYGRLPLMITENCIVKNVTRTCSCDNFSGIKRPDGRHFPVVRSYGCRNTVLNSKKLFPGRQAERHRLSRPVGGTAVLHHREQCRVRAGAAPLHGRRRVRTREHHKRTVLQRC